MKIGILTFHASHNYGSMLQAYALQTVLSELGIDNVIINFRSAVQKSLIPPPLQWRHPRSSLKKLIENPRKIQALTRKFIRFEQFLNHTLKVTEELATPEDVAKHVAENHYDAIITGSDQIWNPACWDFSTVYLCDFPFDGKRIAYAPSMGSHPEEIIESDLAKIVGLATKYDALSTREQRSCDFLGQINGGSAEMVIDPTLLLNDNYYSKIASPDTVNQPYILYYTPREEKGFFKSAQILAKKLNANIIVTQDFEEYYGYDNVVFKLDCGPKEFLALIKHADYCIGNSFHLLAFSLIFKREFFLLSQENDSRMLNLLEPLGLQDRLIRLGNDIRVLNPIDYSSIDCSLGEIRHKSMSFLTHATNFNSNGKYI